MVSLTLKSPARSPTETITSKIAERQTVRILHPAYGAPNNILFELPATDGTGDDYGVHAVTLHTACAIIANNRFDGQLLTADGTLVAPLEGDDGSGCIAAGELYFSVPSDPQYAIVPNFRSWPFPHDAIPQWWKEMDRRASANRVNVPVGAQVFARDVSCRLTAHEESNELAHIIPDSESAWFAANGMARYGVSNDMAQLKSASNLVLLRADVHNLWDRRTFSVVPKRRPGNGVGWALFAHATSPSDEIYTVYHNRPLLYTGGTPGAYWLARFAWDMFPKLIPFLMAQQVRKLAIRRENGRVEEKDHNADECATLCQGQGRGRSASPTKRPRSNTSTDPNLSLSTSQDSGVSQLDAYNGTDDEAGGPEENLFLDDHRDEARDACGRARREEQEQLWLSEKDIGLANRTRQKRSSSPSLSPIRGRKARRYSYGRW